jgi:protein-tyrosine phosphatase
MHALAGTDVSTGGDQTSSEGRLSESILIVCTANVCRSPMAEALFRAEVSGRAEGVEVRSAGFLKSGAPADKNAVWALNNLGLDLSDHQSSTVASAIADNPDLVLVMARAHLRSLSRLDAGVLSHAFTLKEFVRLADIEGDRHLDESLAEYLRRVHSGRRSLSMMSAGREDDVEDPIGRGKSSFSRCASELQILIRQAVGILYPLTANRLS